MDTKRFFVAGGSSGIGLDIVKALQKKGNEIYVGSRTNDQLAGLGRTNPKLALALAIFMFSMAGIPPLAGFFAKYYVFLAAIEAHLYTLAVIGLLTSVVAAFYYLRIVKLMYFDEPVDAFDVPVGREISTIVFATSVITALFVFPLQAVLTGAAVAAATLFAL